MEATIGISTASATIWSMVASKSLITEADSSAVPRLIKSHEKRLRTVFMTVVGNALVADAAEPQDVLLGLLLDDVDHVVDRHHADEALVGVHHRRRLEVVALELARHLLLVGGRQHDVAGRRP